MLRVDPESSRDIAAKPGRGLAVEADPPLPPPDAFLPMSIRKAVSRAIVYTFSQCFQSDKIPLYQRDTLAVELTNAAARLAYAHKND